MKWLIGIVAFLSFGLLLFALVYKAPGVFLLIFGLFLIFIIVYGYFGIRISKTLKDLKDYTVRFGIALLIHLWLSFYFIEKALISYAKLHPVWKVDADIYEEVVSDYWIYNTGSNLINWVVNNPIVFFLIIYLIIVSVYTFYYKKYEKAVIREPFNPKPPW